VWESLYEPRIYGFGWLLLGDTEGKISKEGFANGLFEGMEAYANKNIG